MTPEIEGKIEKVLEKLARLSKQHAVVQKENRSLKAALEEARLQVKKTADGAEALQHQLDARKYVGEQMSDGDKKAFEKKINLYIREIDKCIALLSV